MITVVIPTRNRVEHLRRALTALLNQETNDPWEVIVVNDGSSDGTRVFLEAQNNPPFRVINHDTPRGKSEARNSGVRAAQGEIICFTDDDMVVDKSWLKELNSTFSTTSTVGAYGETIYGSGGQKHFFPERVVANPRARFPMGGNIAYRREVFARVGLFDSAFDVYNNEDTEFALRALRTGNLVANRRARAVHSRDMWTVKNLLKSAKNAGVWPLLIKKYSPEINRATFRLPLLGRLIYPGDLLALIVSPILIPMLFIRYLLHGGRNFKIFFAKWPVLLILRRLIIWREAIRHRVLAL